MGIIDDAKDFFLTELSRDDGHITELQKDWLSSLGYSTGHISERWDAYLEDTNGLLPPELSTGLLGISGTEFTPGLLLGNSAGLIVDPSTSSLFQSSTGETQVAADDPVGYIEDTSGNGNHLIQATATSRPIYKTSGGLHWLDFDGIDDVLTNSLDVNTICGGEYEIIVAGRFDTIGTDTTAFQNEAILGDAAGYLSVYARSSGLIGLYHYHGTTASAVTRSYTAANDFVFAARRASSNIYAAINGGADSAATAAAGLNTSATTLQVGRQFNSNTYCLDGRLYFLMIIPRALTTPERNLIVTHAASKSGVTLTR